MNWNPESISSAQINDLRRAAERAWGDDTRHENYIGHPQPSEGQCFVTAQWLVSKLGGYVGTKRGHYFWVSPDKSHIIDLSGDWFAYEPMEPGEEGVQQDAEDEPWVADPHLKTHRAGPAMYKRADHPLWKGFRVIESQPNHPRAAIFAQRANAALKGRTSSTHEADLMGADPYPGETPQAIEDMNQLMHHDEPDYNPESDLTTHNFQFVYANGQLHVSPKHDHDELLRHAEQDPNEEAPVALGNVEVNRGHAIWRVTSNIALQGLSRALKDYSRQVGWKWDGMTGSDGQPLNEDYGPILSMWYRLGHTAGQDPRLIMSPKPLPKGRRIRIEGSTAYVPTEVGLVADALKEWAQDFGYKLAEYPGGGEFEDKMKRKEDLELYNRGDTDFSPEPISEHDPSGPFECQHCGQVIRDFGSFKLHMDDHQPKDDVIEDGHFPQIQDFDNPLGFGTNSVPNTGLISKTAVIVLPTYKEAERIHEFKLYAGLFGYDRDEGHQFYGAYRNGELVGYGVMRLADFAAKGEPEALMVWSARKGSGVGSAILSRMQTHFDHFYTHADSKGGERLMRRQGMVNVSGHLWKWSAGDAPKDMIEAAIPFIYDIQGDDQHKDGNIVIGYPGQKTSDIPGQFTPGGIVEGYYEPGGKMVIMSATTVPFTVHYLVKLWYALYPQMEVTSVERQGQDGQTSKIAAEAGFMYHVAPQEYREHIQRKGLYPRGAENPAGGSQGFDISNDPWLSSPYYQAGALPVYLSHEAGRSADTRYDTTGKDIWKVNTQGLPLVADLPGLYDNGANMEDGYAWYNDGYTPPALQPYDDEDAGIAHRDLLDPNHPASQAAIQTTQTAAHLGPIPPERLQLMSAHTAHKTSAQDVGSYLRTLTQTDPAAEQAYKALREAGGKVYVVGGAIRDALQQREPRDIDLMVAGLPTDDVAHTLDQLPGRVDLTGKRFGVYRYNVGGSEVEIALPRQDKYETSRRGEGVITVDHDLPVETDLHRRDFTVNSMAVDLDNGQLVDPYGGAKDLENNVLRTTHPDSFSEDPTRLVRAMTAHSRFGLHPDERTRHEMEENAHLLAHESPDALNQTLDKLFKSPNPAAAIRLGHETGVLHHIFPEVSGNFDFDQNNPHHSYPLGEHLLHVLHNTAEQTTDPDVRMAALLHDIGKPASEWRDPDTGKSHYYQNERGEGADHETVGAQMAYDRLRALNYPVARINRVTGIIQGHMFPAFSSPKGARKFLQKYEPHADDLLTIRQADMTGKGQSPEELAARTSVDTQRQLVDEARKAQAPTDVSNLSVNGNDLISLGLTPGPQVGQVLRQLTNDVVEEPMLNDRDRLMQRAQEYINALPS